MKLLCFDISSGGISAALLNSSLEPIRFAESPWDAAALRAETVTAEFKNVVQRLNLVEPISALCIGTFMHNFVLLDEADQLTAIFTAMGGTARRNDRKRPPR